jgi:2-haloacid dehalogenase
LINQYKGFLIDLDNTLFDFDRAQKEALQETLPSLPVNFNQLINQFKQINQEFWHKYERKEIELDSLRVERFRQLLNPYSINLDVKELSKNFLDKLSLKAYLLPGAAKVVEYLSKRAMLCLITNGITNVQRVRIARAKLEVFFNAVLISEEIGLSKPDPQFFLKACESLYLQPYEVLCIGDSPAADIYGAHLAGIDSCWFNKDTTLYPQDLPKPNYTITSLLELRGFAADIS